MKKEIKVVAIVLVALIVFLSGYGLGASKGIQITISGAVEVNGGAVNAGAVQQPATQAPVTQAPTQAPVTQAPTQAPAGDDTTDAPATDAPATEAPKEDKGGCGSSVALSALAIVGVIGTALVIKKKED